MMLVTEEVIQPKLFVKAIVYAPVGKPVGFWVTIAFPFKEKLITDWPAGVVLLIKILPLLLPQIAFVGIKVKLGCGLILITEFVNAVQPDKVTE